MDFVGFGIVTTFLSMLGAGALAVQTQRPPSEHACTQCPASGKDASISLSWNAIKSGMAIEACDQKALVGDRCHEACLETLRAAYPKTVSSTVIG
jgi:hypothetical protein